jgi:hypothetical protein
MPDHLDLHIAHAHMKACTRALRRALDLLDAAGPTVEPSDDDIGPLEFDSTVDSNPEGKCR